MLSIYCLPWLSDLSLTLAGHSKLRLTQKAATVALNQPSWPCEQRDLFNEIKAKPLRRSVCEKRLHRGLGGGVGFQVSTGLGMRGWQLWLRPKRSGEGCRFTALMMMSGNSDGGARLSSSIKPALWSQLWVDINTNRGEDTCTLRSHLLKSSSHPVTQLWSCDEQGSTWETLSTQLFLDQSWPISYSIILCTWLWPSSWKLNLFTSVSYLATHPLWEYKTPKNTINVQIITATSHNGYHQVNHL